MGKPEQVEVRGEIAADARKIWEVISGIGAVDRWFPAVIRTCRVEGEGVGAKRYCTMGDGTNLEERIVGIDQERLSFSYEIDDNPNMPASKIRGAMTLKSLGQDRAELTWKADYEPREGMAGVMKKMLEEVYPAGIKSLEAYCRAASVK
jgi:uncharacterized protein YndB with AHSA1/START domain